MAADKSSSSGCNLPPEKVFSIQIGTELFRLSGASIASDGYHVQPKDGSQFVKLFADSQFYSLPRLMSQLFESEIIIQIGDRHFQIPRDIFSNSGDSPNFFSLGFAAFFASPAEVFPGLDRRGLLRPPAIVPPSVPNRDGEVFAQLLHLLRGYPLHIQNEAHRTELLRDCRYFHLRGLEQKLIPHHISVNPIRGRSEIIIRLEDVRRSGIDIETDNDDDTRVTYSRPFVDEPAHDLVLEIGDENTLIDLRSMRPKFLNLTNARVASLLQIIVDKRNSQPSSGSSHQRTPSATIQHPIRIQIEDEADLTVDGEQQLFFDQFTGQSHVPDFASVEPQTKRRRVEGSQFGNTGGGGPTWIVRNGQWRISMQPGSSQDSPEFVMAAVKLDVYTSQRMRNKRQAFLGS
ncbi:hypothetical protein P175DRAFT_0433207 [Aspergillus ochraceoroseus IBT 24754]|uniref:Uncharacterized protein n=1 Tax=Aspergillus ochraceoroseus IBT 24754 TaxID=1392256 RepID=A0A2T5M3T3_9EURO|nr:uncharacterized protein P175DRAFT_0433207 [Aspergillus ochraceoroseus IBT 24754]PTU23172.1 hypothetical protein P175DRAFT_0433207 [Aspergillus ochraceoroseus IBT 24754]